MLVSSAVDLGVLFRFLSADIRVEIKLHHIGARKYYHFDD